MAASSSSPSSDALSKPSAFVEGAADGLADGLEREQPERGVHESLHRTGERLERDPSSRSQRLRARLDHVEDKVDEVVDKTRVRARAVAETARRAREAPPTLAEELTGALRSWTSGIAKGIGLTVAAGLVAAIAFTVFTIGLVQGLNLWLGAPWGTFLVALVYAAVAFGFYGMGKGKAAEGRQEAKAQLIAAKEEVRHVTRPVRRAFRGDDDLAARSGALDSTGFEALPDEDGFEAKGSATFEERYLDDARP
jgi:hypothetical protein